MKINISIQGTTPLITNRFTEQAAMSSSDGVRSSMSNADRGTPLEIAESRLYLDRAGKPCIPQPNLLRCLIEGGRFYKTGKTQVTTQKSSLLYAAIDIEGVAVPIEHRQPWKVDTRPVRIPTTGGRVLGHRPMFDDWALSFVMTVDVSIVSVKLMRQIVDDAGKRIGLGDFRPATKGPFGRFVVTRWAEMSDDAEDIFDLPIAAE